MLSGGRIPAEFRRARAHFAEGPNALLDTTLIDYEEIYSRVHASNNLGQEFIKRAIKTGRLIGYLGLMTECSGETPVVLPYTIECGLELLEEGPVGNKEQPFVAMVTEVDENLGSLVGTIADLIPDRATTERFMQIGAGSVSFFLNLQASLERATPQPQYN